MWSARPCGCGAGLAPSAPAPLTAWSRSIWALPTMRARSRRRARRRSPCPIAAASRCPIPSFHRSPESAFPDPSPSITQRSAIMSDLPKSVRINEEGPREGFQFEKGPIPTARKLELIDSLSRTGLKQIQTMSFVPPKNVPGMADADEVVKGFTRAPGVSYTGLWLKDKGLELSLIHI